MWIPDAAAKDGRKSSGRRWLQTRSEIRAATQHTHAPAVSGPHAPLRGLHASAAHCAGVQRTPAAFSPEHEVRSCAEAAAYSALAATLRLPSYIARRWCGARAPLARLQQLLPRSCGVVRGRGRCQVTDNRVSPACIAARSCTRTQKRWCDCVPRLSRGCLGVALAPDRRPRRSVRCQTLQTCRA